MDNSELFRNIVGQHVEISDCETEIIFKKNNRYVQKIYFFFSK